MDDRQPDTLNDAAIDREIEAILAVEPSPEFLARVRMQIADQHAAPRRFRLLVPTACAVAVVVVVAFTMRQVERDDVNTSVPVQTAGPQRRDAMLESETAKPVEPLAERSSPVPLIVHARTRAITLPPAEPEVLISPDDKASFEYFMTSVNDGRFIVSTDTATQLADTHARNDLAIAPLAIDALGPIEPLVATEGVNQ